MEIGFDQNNWRMQPQSRDGDSIVRGLDWHALRARLGAAYAARTALSETASTAGSGRSGCFDLDSARLVAAYGSILSDVNQAALGNGNSESGKDTEAAGHQVCGGRG